MLSSLSWRSWSVATGKNLRRAASADAATRRISGTGIGTRARRFPIPRSTSSTISRYVQYRGPPSCSSRPTFASSASTWTAVRARSATANGWKRALPLPVMGVIPGDSRTRLARMLKNPSRGPYITDGERTVQSRPLDLTRSIALAFVLA